MIKRFNYDMLKTIIILLFITLLGCDDDSAPIFGPQCEVRMATQEELDSGRSLEKSFCILRPGYHSGEYFINLLVGGQEIEVVADTGSSDLVLNAPPELCPSCKPEVAYHPSETAVASNREIPLGYGSGSGKAKEYKDSAAPICQPDNAHVQAFALLEKNVNLPNILGLAYKHLSSSRLLPYFDLLLDNSKDELSDIFTMSLCGYRGGSEIILGNIDPDVDRSDIQFAEVTNETYYVVDARKMYVEGWVKQGNKWQQKPGKYIVGNFGTQSGKSVPTILDSGTTLNYPSRDVVNSLVSLMKTIVTAKKLNIPASSWTAAERDDASRIDIDEKTIAAFPNLIIEFRANDKDTFIELAMTPQTYFKKLGRKYIFSFRVHDKPLRTYILGQPFMENFYIEHDRANQRIGFVRNETLCGAAKAKSAPAA